MDPTSLINKMKLKVKFIKDGHPVMALEGTWDDDMDEDEDKTAVALVNVIAFLLRCPYAHFSLAC